MKKDLRRMNLQVRKELPLHKRFDSQCKEGWDGCWLFLGTLDTQGYGQIWVNGKTVRGHRLSWNLHKGEIPPNLWVLHSCDRPSCVNPSHLFLGTPKDNTQDMIKKGRGRKPAPIIHSKDPYEIEAIKKGRSQKSSTKERRKWLRFEADLVEELKEKKYE